MNMTVEKKEWEKINAPKGERPVVQSYDSYWDLPPASISIPIKGAAGRTGNWRTFRPVIDNDVCIKCYQCFMYCPEGTIAVDKETGFIVYDYDYCKGCGICASVCPKKCIKMTRES